MVLDEGFGDSISSSSVCSDVKVDLITLRKVSGVVPLFLSKDSLCIDDKDALIFCRDNCSRFYLNGSRVLPKGSLESEVVFVLADPTDMEREGSSQGFQQILDVMGWNLESIYVTYVTFCRGFKFPSDEEILCCSVFKKKEFSLLKNVKYVFCFGPQSLRMMTGSFSISLQGIFGVYYYEWILESGKVVNIIPVHHPGYAFRNPSLMDGVLEFFARIKFKG